MQTPALDALDESENALDDEFFSTPPNSYSNRKRCEEMTELSPSSDVWFSGLIDDLYEPDSLEHEELTYQVHSLESASGALARVNDTKDQKKKCVGWFGKGRKKVNDWFQPTPKHVEMLREKVARTVGTVEEFCEHVDKWYNEGLIYEKEYQNFISIIKNPEGLTYIKLVFQQAALAWGIRPEPLYPFATEITGGAFLGFVSAELLKVAIKNVFARISTRKIPFWKQQAVTAATAIPWAGPYTPPMFSGEEGSDTVSFLRFYENTKHFRGFIEGMLESSEEESSQNDESFNFRDRTFPKPTPEDISFILKFSEQNKDFDMSRLEDPEYFKDFMEEQKDLAFGIRSSRMVFMGIFNILERCGKKVSKLARSGKEVLLDGSCCDSQDEHRMVSRHDGVRKVRAGNAI